MALDSDGWGEARTMNPVTSILCCGFGATIRTVPAADYRGGRLRLTALVQGDDVSRSAGL